MPEPKLTPGATPSMVAAALAAEGRQIAAQVLSADIRVVLQDPAFTFEHFWAFKGAGTLEGALRAQGLNTVGDVTGINQSDFFGTAKERLSALFGISPDYDETDEAYFERKGLSQAFMTTAENLLEKHTLSNQAQQPQRNLTGHSVSDKSKAECLLPLTVLRSAAGFYVGTVDGDGMPNSRESVQYWGDRKDAIGALARGEWEPRGKESAYKSDDDLQRARAAALVEERKPDNSQVTAATQALAAYPSVFESKTQGSNNVPQIEKVIVNGYPAIKCQLVISKGSFSYSRSAIGKMPASNEFSWLMGILEGHDVEATVFSSTNVAGHTTADQLRQAFATLNPEYSFWIKQPQLDAVIAKFGDGTLGFSMGGMYCAQTPAEIQKLLDSVSSSPDEAQANLKVDSPHP